MKPFAHTALEVRPVLAEEAASVDAEARFPKVSLDALRSAGLFGLLVPEQFGGLGGDLGDMVDVSEILADGCLSTAMIWAMHCQQVDAVVRHATPTLREELLPRIASGYYLASVTTEPGKGGHLLTASSPLGGGSDRLALDRPAPIVTGGEEADGFLITMRAAADAPPNKVTLVHADRSQLAVEVTGGWDSMGMRGTRSVPMHLCGIVEPHQRIGPDGGFGSVARDSMIPAGHLGWAACWIGAARGALNRFVEQLRARGGGNALDEAARHRLARVRIDLEVATSHLDCVRDDVLQRRRQGDPMDDWGFQVRLDALKVVASEVSYRAVDHLVQQAGAGLGYLRSSPVPLERILRDLRSASINYNNDRLLSGIGALTLVEGSGRGR